MTRLILLLLLAAPASAQTMGSQTADTSAVTAPIRALFDGMRQADSTLMRSAFHPDATIRTTQASRGSAPSVTETPVDAFVASIAGAGVYLDERLTSTTLHVDGPLATAWTGYRFYVDGQFSHCGVNAFTLVHTDDTWRILHVVDTRRLQNCAE